MSSFKLDIVCPAHLDSSHHRHVRWQVPGSTFPGEFQKPQQRKLRPAEWPSNELQMPCLLPWQGHISHDTSEKALRTDDECG